MIMVSKSSECWSEWWTSCNNIDEPSNSIPSSPMSATLKSPCLRQPKVKATAAQGRIKYIKVSWNSWLARNEYGAIKNIAGSKRQCTAQTDDIVIPKLSIIFCIGVIRIVHIYHNNDSIFR